MAGRIRPDARSFPCICCDRRSTAGPLRLDEILKNAFSKVLLLHNVPSPHWQRAFPYGTSRLGGISLGGILAKIMAFPLPGTCAFLFTTHCDIGDCAQFAPALALMSEGERETIIWWRNARKSEKGNDS